MSKEIYIYIAIYLSQKISKQLYQINYFLKSLADIEYFIGHPYFKGFSDYWHAVPINLIKDCVKMHVYQLGQLLNGDILGAPEVSWSSGFNCKHLFLAVSTHI